MIFDCTQSSDRAPKYVVLLAPVVWLMYCSKSPCLRSRILHTSVEKSRPSPPDIVHTTSTHVVPSCHGANSNYRGAPSPCHLLPMIARGADVCHIYVLNYANAGSLSPDRKRDVDPQSNASVRGAPPPRERHRETRRPDRLLGRSRAFISPSRLIVVSSSAKCRDSSSSAGKSLILCHYSLWTRDDCVTLRRQQQQAEVQIPPHRHYDSLAMLTVDPALSPLYSAYPPEKAGDSDTQPSPATPRGLPPPTYPPRLAQNAM